MHGTIDEASELKLALARWEANRPMRPANAKPLGRLLWWWALYRHEGQRPNSQAEELHQVAAP